MRFLLCTLAVIAAPLAVPGAAAAQDSTSSASSTTAIRPGMTEADVRARWGNPAVVRTSGEWKFLSYRNGMERSVGWMDTVFLQNGQVVDCIARGAGHEYAGQSSSPPGASPSRTLNHGAARDSAGAVTGVHISP